MSSAALPTRSYLRLVTSLGLQVPAPTTHGRNQAANDTDAGPVNEADLFRVCGDGERTQHLTRLAVG